MIQFNDVTLPTFLQDYWQKKPLLIRNALPDFIPPISAEEMAGLSLEEEVESRIVVQHSETDYELKTGPFDEDTYQNLPENNWTLLIQGMDRLMPEVADLLDEFSFIPRWRIDDIMVSYATKGGNVGPHFDHYDVFLLQAQGKRNWQLTAQNCHESNYIQGVDLRLMQSFQVEDDYVCEPGDILYLPPKWGHHGVGLTDDCMTFSIGYRTYRGLELWDSFGDFLAETEGFKTLYQDPSWQNCHPGEINEQAWQAAKSLLQTALDDETSLKTWFGRFATQLDQTANELLPEALSNDETPTMEELLEALYQCEGIIRDDVFRFAYTNFDNNTLLYVNSQLIETHNAEKEMIQLLCNQRLWDQNTLHAVLENSANHPLLMQLWSMQAFQILD